MTRNPLSELHRKAGAEMGTFLGCALPAHFVGLAQEYRFGRESAAVLDTNYHAFAYLTGADRVRYLNAVVTCNVKDLLDGQGAVGLLLNAQGHILAELQCYALGDRLLAISHTSVRQRTMETLEKYIIMDDAAVEDVSDRLGSVAIEGPRAAAMLYEMCGLKLEAMAPYAHREVVLGAVQCRVLRVSHFGLPGVEFIAEREALPALWQTLVDAARGHGGGPVAYTTLNTLRLEAGVPWFGYDFDDKAIPHEAALETSHINYTKGCYTGQEIVERVRSRGHVNRRRVGLKFSGDSLPGSDAPLLAGGNEVGRVTSAAYSPMHQCNIGMGYVRRGHNATGSVLQWAGGTAEVVILGGA